MTVAYESWGANAPAYPELVVSFPDGSSCPCEYSAPLAGGGRELHRAQRVSQPRRPLLESIELGERLTRLLERSGDFNLRQRGPKANSVRALAEQMQGAIPPSSMWRAITIYQLSLQYPELASYRHLGVAHLSALLTFRGQLRLGLIRKAEHLGWSRRHLQSLAREIKRDPGQDWIERLELKPYLP